MRKSRQLQAKPGSVSVECQTIIRVYPHILDVSSLPAKITAERGCQTEVSAKSDMENKNFYSMLEYVPFQDIQDNSLRVLNLPRKQKLKFVSPLTRLSTIDYLLIDDDGLSQLCLDMKEVVRSADYRLLKPCDDKDTQTELQVRPHVLQTDTVATVSTNVQVQTDQSGGQSSKGAREASGKKT